MTHSTHPSLTVAAAALAGAAIASAARGSEVDPRIAEQLQQLKTEIAEYRASSSDPGAEWLTEARAQEIRSLVSDVLADADSRASLQSSGMTAGWDKGFFLASPDGNYKLKISGYAQIRWNYNHRDNPGAGLDSNVKGFENRRTYLTFEGNIVDPSWQYRLQGNFGRNGGGFLIQDAWVKKSLDNGLFIQAGQAKSPFLRETLVGDTGLLTVDRSLIDAEFGAGRTQGVFVGWQNDSFRIVGSFNDGMGTTGGFATPWNATTTEWAFTGRAEFKWGGDWSQFNDMTSFPGESFSGLIGAAANVQRGENGTAADETEIFTWTVDAEVDFGGANLFGAVVGRHLENNLGTVDADQFGIVGQGGFFVCPEAEIFARYEWGDSDNGDDDLSLVTAGVNWYVSKQQIKISADLGYGINSVAGFWGNGSIGTGGAGASWLTDGAGEDGQFVVRTQLQITF